MNNEAKQKAVQRVYIDLSSNDYTYKINDISNQLNYLGKDLKTRHTIGHWRNAIIL